MKPFRLLLLGTQPMLDVNFLNEAIPGGMTFSGGANGTRVNSAGAMAAASTPRFNYDQISRSAKGALIEEARESKFQQSANLGDVYWNKINTTIGTPAVGPDGTETLDKIVETAATGEHYVRRNITATAGATASISWFVKAAERTFARVRVLDAAAPTDGGYVDVNLSTGATSGLALGAGTAFNAVAVAWPDGLWRLTLTIKPNGTATTYTCDLFACSASGTTSYAGDITKGIYGGFAGFEEGAFSTSHIPNVASALTRSADVASLPWTLADGTYAVEFDLNAVTGTRPILSFDDGTADNQIRLYASGTDLKLTVTTGGVTQADLTLGTVAANTTYKAAFSIRANEFRALMNGGTEQSDTAGTVPVVTTGRIGSDVAGNYQNGHSKRIRQWRQIKNLWPLVA